MNEAWETVGQIVYTPEWQPARFIFNHWPSDLENAEWVTDPRMFVIRVRPCAIEHPDYVAVGCEGKMFEVHPDDARRIWGAASWRNRGTAICCEHELLMD